MKKEISISESVLKISDSEWKVMEILWDKPKSTIKEITDALKDTEWSYSTIRTLVVRLCEKGAIAADTTIGNYKYYPVILEKECKKKETKNFLNRIYNGSVKVLMSTLVSDSNLSEKEVNELMSIIDKMEEGGGK